MMRNFRYAVSIFFVALLHRLGFKQTGFCCKITGLFVAWLLFAVGLEARAQNVAHDLQLLKAWRVGTVVSAESVKSYGEKRCFTQEVIPDAVFARLPISRPGAFAEYVAVPADAVARMPEGLSFEEAASIPLTALTAYQALDLLEAKPGSSIFISGGSGGLGAMAIPLAKARGLKVYTNGNSASRDRVMALGADRYLDYRKEDYLEVLEPVDYVLDSLGGKELERQMQLLRRGGKIVSLRGMPNARFAKRFGLPTWERWLFALAAFGVERKARQLGVSYEFLFVQSNGRQLAEVARLIGEKGIQPSVGQVFPFAETNDALRKVASGGASGKVVLSFT